MHIGTTEGTRSNISDIRSDLRCWKETTHFCYIWWDRHTERVLFMTDLSQLRGRGGASEMENIHCRGGHLCLVITISWLGSHLHSCCQEAQRAWIFVISLVLVPALVIAAQPHTRTHVNTNVPSTFLCSGQCVVALSTATGVSFSLFTHPAFVKMPWENRNVEGSSAAEVDKSLRVKTFSPGL